MLAEESKKESALDWVEKLRTAQKEKDMAEERVSGI